MLILQQPFQPIPKSVHKGKVPRPRRKHKGEFIFAVRFGFSNLQIDIRESSLSKVVCAILFLQNTFRPFMPKVKIEIKSTTNWYTAFYDTKKHIFREANP